MKVEYSSNNSGGGWWLDDKDWIALEKAGWEVVWGNQYFCSSDFLFNKKPEGKEDCGLGKKCQGHRKYETFEEAKNDRWLGAAAKEASKEFPSMKEAIEEWEEITGQDASDEGCNCCGSPHSFNSKDEYASGEDVLNIKYGDIASKSKEELIKMLKD